jgi:sialic acid synthase SpsE
MKKKLIFIAEIGLNHNGNFDLCFELIKQAKFAGADIVKFQLGWRDKPSEMNQFNKQRISKLIEWAEYF